MQVKNLNLIWNLILNGGNIFQKHVKAFLGQTKHTCESDPSCGQLFCNFFCVHELFRGSWFLIQYLSPSMNLSFVGYHSCGMVLWTVFRVHMDLGQHLHLSLGQSGKFQGWGAPSGVQGGQAMPGNLKEMLLYLETSLTQRQDIWVLTSPVWSPSLSWNKLLFWVCFLLYKMGGGIAWRCVIFITVTPPHSRPPL